jgi:drug/metabolite transporter (DMT)-like permease
VTAAFLALSASLLWGTSDFLGGLESRRTSVWGVALVSQFTAVIAALAVLAVVAPTPPSTAGLIAPIVAGCALTMGALTQYRAMEIAPMSVVAPIFAGAALVPAVWGLARGERPGAIQLTGMALTIVGIILISRPAGRTTDSPRSVPRAGVALALLAALSVGVVLVAYDYGGDVDPYWTVAVARLSALLLMSVVVGSRRPRLHLTRKAVFPIVLVGVFLLAANVLFTAATTMGLLSVVAVLGWLSPAVTMFWAQAVLHERLRPTQWAIAGLILAGVVCLALG